MRQAGGGEDFLNRSDFEEMVLLVMHAPVAGYSWRHARTMPPLHPPDDSANPAAFREPRSASPLSPLGSSLVRPSMPRALPLILPADSAYEPRQACAIDLSRYNCRRQRRVTQITGGGGGRGNKMQGRGHTDHGWGRR